MRRTNAPHLVVAAAARQRLLVAAAAEGVAVAALAVSVATAAAEAAATCPETCTVAALAVSHKASTKARTYTCRRVVQHAPPLERSGRASAASTRIGRPSSIALLRDSARAQPSASASVMNAPLGFWVSWWRITRTSCTCTRSQVVSRCGS